MQYSDRPAGASFTKASRNEIVNPLQSKAVCTLPNSLSLANSSTQPNSLKENPRLHRLQARKIMLSLHVQTRLQLTIHPVLIPGIAIKLPITQAT